VLYIGNFTTSVPRGGHFHRPESELVITFTRLSSRNVDWCQATEPISPCIVATQSVRCHVHASAVARGLVYHATVTALHHRRVQQVPERSLPACHTIVPPVPARVWLAPPLLRHVLRGSRAVELRGRLSAKGTMRMCR
jgi:hypothetical protein